MATPDSKLTRPEVPDAFVNRRLFARLDSDLGADQVVWIGAPAGSGKTTLLSSYAVERGVPCLWIQLDAADRDPARLLSELAAAARRLAPGRRRPLPHLGSEYATDLEAFARSFFEVLCASLPDGTLVVLDDAQFLGAPSEHQALLTGLTSASRGRARLVVLSRQSAPACLARLQVQRKLTYLGWPELQLGDEEARALLAAIGASPLARDRAGHLNQVADGWAAGLVLLAGSAREWARHPEHDLDLAPQAVFDYFTAEFFGGLDATEQRFLLALSLLPEATAPTAQDWTGERRARAILERLCREQLFLLRRPGRPPTYQLHRLFRDFLKYRLKLELGDGYEERCREAAVFLERQQLVDAAVELLEESGDPDAMAAFVGRQAEALARQGRLETLGRCLEALPEATVADDPWLSYWAGVRLLPYDTVAAGTRFAAAYARFVGARERRGAFLAWARLVEAQIYESGGYTRLDHWLDQHEQITRTLGPPVSPEAFVRVKVSLFNALLFRRSESPALRETELRLRLAMRVAPDVNTRFLLGATLVRYYNWIGDLPATRAVLNRLRSQSDSPALGAFSRVVWFAITSACGWLLESAEAGLQAADEGFALAQKSGIHLFDFYFLVQGTYSALALGRLELAEGFVERMPGTFKPERSVDMGQCLFLQGWLQFAKGRHEQALSSLEEAMEAAVSTGSPYVLARAHHGLAQAQVRCGQLDAASASLEACLAISGPHGFLPLVYLADLCRAELETLRGRTLEADRALGAALRLGEARGYGNIPLWTREQLAALCGRALEAGIEPQYATELIRRHRLDPPAASHPAAGHWPLPVKVFTLGSFAVQVEGEPLRFERKEQGRPLDLLKVLIALGGERVRTHRVAEALWPDADGDGARDALKTTLARLRKLVGKEAIEQAEGCLSLNERLVWVDALAVERELNRALAEGDPASGARAALALYGGAFLADEPAAPWAIAPRDRLRSSFARCVERGGAALLEAGAPQEALDLYLRGLGVDAHLEAFYLGAMRCQVRLGRSYDALQTFEQHLKLLAAAGVGEPSPVMLELRDRLLAEGRTG